MININVGKNILDQSQPSIQEMPSQTSNTRQHSLYSNTFDTYNPKYDLNYDFLNFIRRTVPILDTAIIKTMQLIGKYRIETYGNKNLERLLIEFTDNVKVNYLERGCYEIVKQLSDSALETGTGILEVIPAKALTNIARLKVVKTKDIKFLIQGEEVVLGRADAIERNVQPFQYQNLIHTVAFDRRQGEPKGKSMFYSLPFMVDVFHKIMGSIKNQIWRLGDPIFCITIEGIGDSQTDYAVAKKYKTAIEAQFREAFKAKMMGKVADVYGATPGNAKLVIKALGSDIQFPPLEIPLRTILEQIIAKTNFPPFFFGIHWAATYNITTHQSYMIINTIKDYREAIDQVLDKVYDMFLILTGNAGAKYKRVWDEINLTDLVEKARARHLNAVAKEKELNILAQAIAFGWTPEQEAIDILIENDIIPRSSKKELGYNGSYQKYLQKKVDYILAKKVFSWTRGTIQN